MNRIMDVAVVLIGAVLVLPGLCSIAFLAQFFLEPIRGVSDYAGMLLVILIPTGICLLISVLGVWLIRIGLRSARQRRLKAAAAEAGRENGTGGD